MNKRLLCLIGVTLCLVVCSFLLLFPKNNYKSDVNEDDYKNQEIYCETVSLDKTNITLSVGESASISATILPSDTTDKTLAWSSTDPTVAVYENGEIKGLKAGSTVITATASNGKNAICSVIVIDDIKSVAVDSVSFNKVNIMLNVGDSETLVATVLPSDATDKTLVWLSSNPSVATVADGIVNAVGEGSAIITAGSVNGKVATCTVSVTAPVVDTPVQSIMLNKDTLTLNVDESYTLIATIMPENATDKTVSWTSSNPSVVTVDDGVLEAVGEGSAQITVRGANGKNAVCTVTVTRPVVDIEVEGIILNKTELSMDVSNSETLVATVAPENATDKTIIWISSDTSVATVSDGVVTALRNGTATITATTSNGKSATCTVTVQTPITSVSGVVLDKQNIDIYVNQEATLLATVSPSNADDKGIVWTSSDTSVVTVSDGVIFGVKMGTATVRATTNDGGFVASCEVTVRVGSIFYTLNSDSGSYVVTGYFGYDNEIEIPDIYEGLRVIEIGRDAFRDVKTLESVIIPNSVVKIGDGAFCGCSSLKEVLIPDSVNYIGEYAFGYCDTLSELTVMGQLDSIGSYAFLECVKLEKIYYNSSTTTCAADSRDIFCKAGVDGNGITLTLSKKAVVPDGLFEPVEKSNAPKLVAVIVEEGALGVDYFKEKNYLPYLNSITFPDTIESVNYGIFNNSLWWSLQDSGLVYINNVLYGYKDKNTFESVIVRDDTVCIASGALSDANTISSLTVPYLGKTATDKRHFYLGYLFGAGNALEQGEFIPSELKSIEIKSIKTEIPSYTFYGCSSLESIAIPDTVVTIGEYAFYGCSSIESIFIPANVREIGADAFSGMPSLSSITVSPDNSIYHSNGSNAIIYTKDKTLVLGCAKTSIPSDGSVTVIASHAFHSAYALTSIVVPNAVKAIENAAFYDCKALASVSLPFVGDGTGNYTHFGYIFGASDYTVNGEYTPSSLKSIFITGGTGISSNAFYGCSDIESITLLQGIKSIGAHAFGNCSALKILSVPDSVDNIHLDAFYGCESLSYNEDDTAKYLGNEANPYVVLVEIKDISITEFDVRQGTNIIWKSAFEGVESLTRVSIHSNVKQIGNRAFARCSSLKSVVVASGDVVLGDSVFYGCASLETITLPFIGDGTESYTNFGYIFGAGDYISNDYYVPSSLKTVIITGGTSVGDYAFYGCDSIESITLPSGVKSIGDSAFYACASLRSMTIPDGVLDIGVYTFGSCWLLQDIDIPSSVTSIGSYAFYDCYSLKSLDIPSDVTSIGNSAFCGCYSLESITLPFVGDGTKSHTNFGYVFGASDYIGNGNCLPYSLKTVEITGGTSIDSNAFYGCYIIERIVLPDSIESIGTYAFYGCSSLKSIEIPNSVTSIGSYAFYDCTSLESISLPFIGNGTEYYTHFGYIFGAGSYSFNSSYVPSSLKRVSITGETSIEDYAFYGCADIECITVSDSVRSIGENAFYGCSSLVELVLPDELKS